MQRIGEVRTAIQFLRLPLAAPKLMRKRSSEPSSVIVLPGFGTNDVSTIPLRAYLIGRGHRCVGWGLGVNGGEVAGTLDAVIEQIYLHAQRHGERCVVLGWSLGGVLAREAARDRPDLISKVVTFGTPLFGPRFTSAVGFYSEVGIREIENQIAARADIPIKVPVTAIYSKADGVVDWRTCIDPEPTTRSLEVKSSHIGLGIDPDVWTIIVNAIER